MNENLIELAATWEARAAEWATAAVDSKDRVIFEAIEMMYLEMAHDLRCFLNKPKS